VLGEGPGGREAGPTRSRFTAPCYLWRSSCPAPQSAPIATGGAGNRARFALEVRRGVRRRWAGLSDRCQAVLRGSRSGRSTIEETSRLPAGWRTGVDACWCPPAASSPPMGRPAMMFPRACPFPTQWLSSPWLACCGTVGGSTTRRGGEDIQEGARISSPSAGAAGDPDFRASAGGAERRDSALHGCRYCTTRQRARRGIRCMVNVGRPGVEWSLRRRGAEECWCGAGLEAGGSQDCRPSGHSVTLCEQAETLGAWWPWEQAASKAELGPGGVLRREMRRNGVEVRWER